MLKKALKLCVKLSQFAFLCACLALPVAAEEIDNSIKTEGNLNTAIHDSSTNVEVGANINAGASTFGALGGNKTIYGHNNGTFTITGGSNQGFVVSGETLTIKDILFTDFSGLLDNSGTTYIYAQNRNMTLSGNSAGSLRNAIDNKGNLYLGGIYTLTVGDSIYNDTSANLYLGNTGYTGKVYLNADVAGAGNVIINGAEAYINADLTQKALTLNSGSLEILASNLNVTDAIQANGGTLKVKGSSSAVSSVNYSKDIIGGGNVEFSDNIMSDADINAAVTNKDTFTNASSGAIQGTLKNDGSFYNEGNITAVITNSESKTFTNQSTGTISIASSDTLTNSGTFINYNTTDSAITSAVLNQYSASFTSAANALQGSITNLGTLIFTGGNNANAISTTTATRGTLQITGDVTNSAAITQNKLEVTGAELATSGNITVNDLLLDKTTESGTTTEGKISGTGGLEFTTRFNKDISSQAGTIELTGSNGLTNNGTLIAKLGQIKNIIKNHGTLTLKGGESSAVTNSYQVTNESETDGTLTFTDNIENEADLKQANITTQGTFTNSTTSTITASTKLTNTGKFTNNNTTADSITAGNIENSGTGAEFTTNASAIKISASGGVFKNLAKLIFTGGTNNNTVTDATGTTNPQSGTLEITGNLTNKGDIRQDTINLKAASLINDTGKLIRVNNLVIDDITGAITGGGSLHISGTNNILPENYTIAQTLFKNTGKFTNNNTATDSITAENIENSGSGAEFITNASAIKISSSGGVFKNTGKLTLNGGENKYVITHDTATSTSPSYGTLEITGNVTNSANVIQNTVNLKAASIVNNADITAANLGFGDTAGSLSGSGNLILSGTTNVLPSTYKISQTSIKNTGKFTNNNETAKDTTTLTTAAITAVDIENSGSGAEFKTNASGLDISGKFKNLATLIFTGGTNKNIVTNDKDTTPANATLGTLQVTGDTANSAAITQNTLQLGANLANDNTITANTISFTVGSSRGGLTGSGNLDLTGTSNNISNQYYKDTTTNKEYGIIALSGWVKNIGTLTAKANQIRSTIKNYKTLNLQGGNTAENTLTNVSAITSESNSEGDLNLSGHISSSGNIKQINIANSGTFTNTTGTIEAVTKLTNSGTFVNNNTTDAAITVKDVENATGSEFKTNASALKVTGTNGFKNLAKLIFTGGENTNVVTDGTASGSAPTYGTLDVTGATTNSSAITQNILRLGANLENNSSILVNTLELQITDGASVTSGNLTGTGNIELLGANDISEHSGSISLTGSGALINRDTLTAKANQIQGIVKNYTTLVMIGGANEANMRTNLASITNDSETSGDVSFSGWVTNDSDIEQNNIEISGNFTNSSDKTIKAETLLTNKGKFTNNNVNANSITAKDINNNEDNAEFKTNASALNVSGKFTNLAKLIFTGGKNSTAVTNVIPEEDMVEGVDYTKLGTVEVTGNFENNKNILQNALVIKDNALSVTNTQTIDVNELTINIASASSGNINGTGTLRINGGEDITNVLPSNYAIYQGTLYNAGVFVNENTTLKDAGNSIKAAITATNIENADGAVFATHSGAIDVTGSLGFKNLGTLVYTDGTKNLNIITNDGDNSLGTLIIMTEMSNDLAITQNSLELGKAFVNTADLKVGKIAFKTTYDGTTLEEGSITGSGNIEITGSGGNISGQDGTIDITGTFTNNGGFTAKAEQIKTSTSTLKNLGSLALVGGKDANNKITTTHIVTNDDNDNSKGSLTFRKWIQNNVTIFQKNVINEGNFTNTDGVKITADKFTNRTGGTLNMLFEDLVSASEIDNSGVFNIVDTILYNITDSSKTGTLNINTASPLANEFSIQARQINLKNNLVGTNGVLTLTGTGNYKNDISVMTDDDDNLFTISQNKVVNLGELIANVNQITNLVANGGKFTLLGGDEENHAVNLYNITDSTANSSSKTNGETVFENFVDNKVKVTQDKITVAKDAVLTNVEGTDGELIANKIVNNGIINSLVSKITATIANKKTLNLKGGANESGILSTSNNIILDGSTEGTTTFEGYINNSGDITQIEFINKDYLINSGVITANITNEGTLITSASKLHGAVDNSSSLILEEGTLASGSGYTTSVSGAGVTTVRTGDVTSDVQIDQNIVIESGSLTINASNIGKGLEDNTMTVTNKVGDAANNKYGLILTGGTLNQTVQNATGTSGITKIDTTDKVTIGQNGYINQEIYIATGALETGVEKLVNKVTNDSELILNNTGNLTQTVEGTGKIVIANTGNIKNQGTIKQDIEIAAGGSFDSALADIVSSSGVTIKNDGTLSLAGTSSGAAGVNKNTISMSSGQNTGTVTFTGNVDNQAAITQQTITNKGTFTNGAFNLTADEIKNEGTLQSSASNIKGAVTNSGTESNKSTLILTGGILDYDVTGENGTTKIQGTVLSNNLIEQAISIEGSGQLTIAAGNIGGEVTNAVTDGLIITTGGKLTQTVKGAGSTLVQAEITLDEQNLIQQTFKITGSGKLTSNASQIEKDLINDANLVLTDGTLAVNVSTTDGNGILQITGNGVTVGNATGSNTVTQKEIQVAANLTNNANIEAQTISIANGKKIDGTGSLTLTGTNTLTGGANDGTIKQGTLTNKGKLTADASKILAGTNIVNDTTGAGTGVLEFTGGTNANNVSGTGTTYIKGDVANEGVISQAVVIESTKKLSTNASNILATVDNSGTLELTGGNVTFAISGDSGVTNIVNANGTGTSTTTFKANVTQNKVNVLNGASLVNEGSNVITAAVDVNAGGSLTSLADKITGTITNNGDVYFTGGTNSNVMTGDGTLHITTNNVGNTANITVGSIDLVTNLTGTGTLTLTGESTLGNSSGTIQQTTLTNKGKLTANASKIVAGTNIVNDTTGAGTGVLEFTGGTNANNVSGTGETHITTGQVTNTGVITQNIKIKDGGKLLTSASKIGDSSSSNTVTNDVEDGLVLNDGTLTKVVNGSGNTKIDGGANTVTIGAGGAINQAVTIASGGLETSASALGGAVTNNVADGLVLNGGNLTVAVGGSQNTVIQAGAGAVTVTGGGAINQAATIASGTLTTSASALGGAITNNSGVLELNGGALNQNVSGTGTTLISGATANNATISQNTLTVNAGFTNNSVVEAANIDLNANITGDGGAITLTGTNDLTSATGTIKQGTLTNKGSLKTNASTIAAGTNIVNDASNGAGKIEFTGGTNANNISGSGSVDILGTVSNTGKISQALTIKSGADFSSSADNIDTEVQNEGTYNIQGGVISRAITGTSGSKITLASGKTTTIGSNSIFGTDNSTNMNITAESGSTISLIGDATKANLANLTIANNADSTPGMINLELDWDDVFDATISSGTVQLTRLDLSKTDGSKILDYDISNLGNKLIVDPLNITLNATETSNNFIRYVNGNIKSGKGTLASIIINSDILSGTTYSLTGDENPGDGTLIGDITISGQGHSLIKDSIVIDGVTLTIRDANLKNMAVKDGYKGAIHIENGGTLNMIADDSPIFMSGTMDHSYGKSIRNAIYLEYYADPGGNTALDKIATATIDARNETVTIDDDIRSDNIKNKVIFKGSKPIYFNGTFDPVTATMSASDLVRDGNDINVAWELNSGILRYVKDSYLAYGGGNSIDFQGGTLDLRNGEATAIPLSALKISANSTLYLDADLRSLVMDNFKVSSANTTYTGGKLNVSDFNILRDAKTKYTRVNFIKNKTDKVAYTGARKIQGHSEINQYLVSYDASTGDFLFERLQDLLHPAILVSPVATQIGGYLTQINSYEQAFVNMDNFMQLTRAERTAIKLRNRYAASDGDLTFNPTSAVQENANMWFRPYTTFESIKLRKGPKVNNVAYGTFVGGDSELRELGNGWDGMWGLYAGYNGARQKYLGNSVHENGGTLGAVGMLYKGDFFTGLTVNVGANSGRATTILGTDEFSMLMAGIASKSGYNFELMDSKFIIQPNFLVSYSFVNTFDYTNADDVDITTSPLHAIQVEPGVQLIANLKNGWQPYFGISMVWNIMDKTKFKANDFSLPELSIKPYVRYGLGFKKNWGDRFQGFLQAYITNGGRNGIGFMAGFSWALGKDPSEYSASKANKKEAKVKKEAVKTAETKKEAEKTTKVKKEAEKTAKVKEEKIQKVNMIKAESPKKTVKNESPKKAVKAEKIKAEKTVKSEKNKKDKEVKETKPEKAKKVKETSTNKEEKTKKPFKFFNFNKKAA